MTANSCEIPADGLNLGAHTHMFLVDVDVVNGDREETQRRAFIDFGQVLKFVGRRPSRISAFISPIGPGTDSVLFGTVQTAFAVPGSQSYALTFANAPTLLMHVSATAEASEVEPELQVYPPFHR